MEDGKCSRLAQALTEYQALETREPNQESEYVDSSSMRRYLRQSSSFDLANVVPLDVNNESRVLVLYTGGTIGRVHQFFRLIPKMARAET